MPPKPPKNEQESRIFAGIPLEFRAMEGESAERHIIGKAVLYAVRTEIWWFTEEIAAGAFAESLQTADVRALLNHDPNVILGRNKAGTLKLTDTASALEFDITLPNSPNGDNVYEAVRRGDITGCSFRMLVLQDEWTYEENGMDHRRVTKAQIDDITLATYPAYSETNAQVRSRVNQSRARRSIDLLRKSLILREIEQ